MIARLWRGQATVDNADRYRRHAIERVFPALARLPGHRGAYLLARDAGDQVEFLALTLWDSIASIKNFSGENPERAVIDPEARAILSTISRGTTTWRMTPPARHRMTIE